ncbi:MAG: Ig-like domain-containing protein [Oscillospiraceae bacterium]|nr:Ig-like domain-containing protein [Oscillospiraceae bacterium]MDY6209052.1 Ig-like domain-containing protein [Oscillospiraceae bacterium]
MTATKKQLKAAVSILLALLLALTFAAFPSEASALGLNASSITITKGYSSTLKVTDGSSATWSSSDTSVASVSSNGKVVGKSVGTATITANVGGTLLTCNVKVVGGKLSLSTKSVEMEKDDVQYVTVRAKGSHGIKATSGDKSIVTASWVKPWKNDDIRLKLTAKGSGSTTVKISMTKYPDVYTTIKVTVKGDDAVLLSSQTSVTTKVDTLASVVIYSDKNSMVNYSFSDNSIAKLTEGTWKDGYCTLGITGLKEGTTTLTITRKDNAAVKRQISITVSGSGYYAVSTTPPARQATGDSILRWTDSKTMIMKYMLVPSGYDIAKANSAVAADSKSYEYYTVYDVQPSKTASNDTISTFSATVNGKAVTRYVLLPASPDTPSYNTVVADYTGTIEYWKVYNKSPENKKFLSTDIVKSWTSTVNYKAVTRYILLPFGYSEDKLNQIISADSGVNYGGYYSVSESRPTLKASNDQIISFPITIQGVSKTYYVLAPANYDEAKVNDAIAAFKGVYEPWLIYTVEPKSQYSYYTVQKWTKVVDGKQTTRYMLVPPGYDENLLKDYINKDLGTSSSAYYSITTSYPVSIASSDKIWMWYNSRESTTKYMLLPEKFNVLKRNDLINADTGTFEYYTIYSNKPSTKSADDVILTPQYNGGVVYMLVPKDWDQAKVNQGLAGLLVN